MTGAWRSRISRAVIGGMLLSLGLVMPRPALAAGELDSTFGGDGKVVTDLGGDEAAQAVAVQADGRIVVGLTVGFGDIKLVRYLPDGSLDPGFGDGGVVTTDFGGSDFVGGLAVLPDGRIVAAGSTFSISTGYGVALARYLSDGSPDPSFGDDGLVTFIHPSGVTAVSLAIQADGRIVAAGSANAPNNPQLRAFGLTRYLPDGSVDSSFGAGGVVITDIDPLSHEFINSVALQADGRIVAAGEWRAVACGGCRFNREFALARYLPDGSLDSSFAGDGTVQFDVPNGIRQSFGTDVVVQADGRIVAAGEAIWTGPWHGERLGFALARLLPDGSFDPSFGTDGFVQTLFGPPDVLAPISAQLRAVAIQDDGRIVAAGVATVDEGASHPLHFALARYLPDGSLDPSFGEGGLLTTDFGGDRHQLADMAIDGNGRIVALGTTQGETLPRDLALARYLATTTTSTTTTSTSTTSTTSTTTTLPPTTTSSSTTSSTTSSSSTSSVPQTTTTGVAAGTCDGRTPTIVGTNGAETIFGTAGPDVIAGGGGNDRIHGLGGDDIICGDAGNDVILGGDGNDTLLGGPGSDRLVGGAGDDSLNGDADADQCLGDAGNDTASTCESVSGVP